MRTTILLREAHCTVYEVECRYHERPAWIPERSRFPELVYPLQGGFLLGDETATAVCLPARLVLIPGGTSYRIRHFRRLPDRTLVIRMRTPFCTPREILHLFLTPGEVCGLHLLPGSLRAGSDTEPDGLASLLANARSRFDAAAIPQSRLAAEEYRLERSLEHMLTADVAVSPQECARSAGCGTHHFRHRFRDTYGTTPHRVVRALRLARALRVLLEGGTATTAARIAGFAHISHLSNELRQTTGRSPSALRFGDRRREPT